MAVSLTGLKLGFDELKSFVVEASEAQAPIHEVEQGIFDRLMKMGFVAVDAHIAEQGNGDVGECLELEDGREFKRLEKEHEREYVSIFGKHTHISRCVYGTRETQKIEAVPLDAVLELPEGNFSYVLQDWDQGFCVEQPFGKSAKQIERIFKLKRTVSSLENMSRSMSQTVEHFQVALPVPPAATEGELFVIAADCKGVPKRREPGDPVLEDPKHPKKGEKKNKKKMACVGVSYTVDSFERTADEIINEVMHNKCEERRPKPKNKRIHANLTREIDGIEVNGKDLTFCWLRQELECRNPKGDRPILFLSDGEHALEERALEWFDIDEETGQCWLYEGEKQTPIRIIFILDLFHALDPLWKVATIFHKEGTPGRKAFVEKRLRMLLEGKVEYVIRGLRQMKTKYNLRGQKAERIDKLITYYENNAHRMRYDEYIAAGYPIGSGVVEGACGHLICDRLDRTGMRWDTEGAQAMLDLRSTWINDQWEEFCEFRVKHETERLYPYRHLLRGNSGKYTPEHATQYSLN